MSFPLIVTLRDNYTEFPRYPCRSAPPRPCTATASNREIGKISLGPDRPALLSRPATSRTWDTRQHQSSRFSSAVVDNLRQPSPRDIVVTHASKSRWTIRLPARLTRKERQEIAFEYQDELPRTLGQLYLQDLTSHPQELRQVSGLLEESCVSC